MSFQEKRYGCGKGSSCSCLARSDLVIALKEAEHRLLLCQGFPGWADRVEYWHIHDVDCGSVEEVLAGIGRQVEALVARLLRSGAAAAGQSECHPEAQPAGDIL